MRIAFLGLGQMGRRMATNLLATGGDVTVWNRSPEPVEAFADKARVAATPGEAARDADVILTMLTDDEASRQVWANTLPHAKPGALAVEMSTLSSGRVAELAQAAKGSGLAFLDAPVAGSLPQADAAQLIFLCGGVMGDLGRFAPLAEAMGSRLIHAGEVGAGTTLKLMVNVLLAVQTATAAELIRFGQAHDLSPERTATLLADLPVTSATMAGALKLIASENYDPMFPVDLLVKDMRYAAPQTTAPIYEATLAVFEKAQKSGHGPKHISAAALV